MLHPQAHIQFKKQPAARFNLASLDWSAGVYRAVIDEHLDSLEPGYEPEYVIAGGEAEGAVMQRLGRERTALLFLLQLTLQGQAEVPEERDNEAHNELLDHLLHLRAYAPALSDGDYRSLDLPNDSVYAFVRETGRQRCYVLLNFSNKVQQIEIKRVGRWIAGTHLVDGDGAVHSGDELELAPYEGRMYELRRGDSDVSDI